ncbi:hypothetical protein ACFWA6_36285, partial [Streptomyces sp. NPDC060020]
MAEAVPVRCPACLRDNGYTAPVFPCACGSPVHPPLDLAAPPVPLTHRTWSDSWVAVRCTACGRESEWPQPELGCGSCGTVVRIPVHPLEGVDSGERGAGGAGAGAEPGPGHSGGGVRRDGAATGQGSGPGPGGPDRHRSGPRPDPRDAGPGP